MYRRNNMRRFARYLARTWKQKLYAVALVACGVLGVKLSGGDGTFLVMVSMFAIPMFFSKKNWID